MSGRVVVLLAVLVVAAAAGLWLTRETPPATATGAGERFAPGLLERINSITRVEVRVAGGTRVADIVRGDDGDWRVANRWGYPADEGVVRGTLIGLGEARRAEARTADPNAHHRLGVQAVDNPDAEGVELGLQGGERSWQVMVGRRSAAGDGTYLRHADESRTWLVDQAIERRPRVADWLDAELVDIAAERVERVAIDPEVGEPLRVRANAAGEFEVLDVPPGRDLLTPRIGRSLARVVTELRLDDVRPRAATEQSQPVAEARYSLRDGLEIRLRTYVADGEEVATLAADATDGADADVRQRAESLDARWRDWFYVLPEYKYVNASHHRERILAPENP